MAGYVLTGEKWGTPVYGTAGGQVTWSFSLAGADPLYDFDRPMVEASFQLLIRAAFAAWEAVANIDFVEVSSGAGADILLGWDAIDGRAGTVGEAAWSHFPGTNVNQTAEAAIRFDTAETWTVDANGSGSATNFYAVALHEIGHVLGLSHNSDATTIMYAYTSPVAELTPGDIAGARAIYGSASSSPPAPSVPPATGGGIGGGGSIAGTDTAERFVGGIGNDTIMAGGGNDTIYAGPDDDGDDSFAGGLGNDLIGGGAGNDHLFGEAGDDTLFGGAGDDRLLGGAGQDIAWAGSGEDVVRGGSENDVLGGGAGRDSLYGEDGADLLYGADGGDQLDGGREDDQIYGGEGNDRLLGGDGADLLFNGGGSDTVDGGSGNDTLWAGSGNDRLIGGAGNDVFAFAAGSGADIVTDFELAGGDMLDLAELGFADTADALAAMANDGSGDAVLTLADGSSISFTNLSVEDFAASARAWVLV